MGAGRTSSAKENQRFNQNHGFMSLTTRVPRGILSIRVLSGPEATSSAGIGDIIVAIKDAIPGGSVSKGDVVRLVVVRTVKRAPS